MKGGWSQAADSSFVRLETDRQPVKSMPVGQSRQLDGIEMAVVHTPNSALPWAEAARSARTSAYSASSRAPISRQS